MNPYASKHKLTSTKGSLAIFKETPTKLAHSANLLVCIAGCVADPTGVVLTGAAASGYLSLKDIFKASTPKAKKLAKEIEQTLSQRLNEPDFHMPADGQNLLVQMIELGLPSPADLTNCALDPARVVALMQDRLSDPEHRKQAMLDAYANLLRPIFERLFADKTFVETLGPAIATETLERLQSVADDLAGLSTAYGTLSNSLEHLEKLHQSQLMALCLKFGLDASPDSNADAMLGQLHLKAEDAQSYLKQIDALDDRIAGVHNLKAAAQDAANRLDFDEVETLLARVDMVETEIMAETKEARATNALLRGRADQAFAIFTAAAESFRELDILEMAERRDGYFQQLYNHGLRYGGTALSRAIDIQRPGIAALKDTPNRKDWAAFTQNLAIALRNQGIRTAGTTGKDLLAEAVTAYRDALTVFTREENPANWAMTTQNLANALKDQGTRTEGTAGTDLLAEAVTAYRDALTVRTREDQPVRWAMTTQNLAIALKNQGTRTEGTAGTDLLAEAVTAYRDALAVFTRKDHRVDWAMTTQNLANALQEQGTRTEGAAGTDLLAEALSTYAEARTVNTRDDIPVEWAMNMENCAIAELSLANHPAAKDPAPHLKAALEHVEAVLTVFDPEHMSYNHAKATRLRDLIRAQLDSL